jgi:hypothetical protein
LFWHLAPRPIVEPGTLFLAGLTDLQRWICNVDLVSDWLRVGNDIAGETRDHIHRHVLAGRPDRPETTSLTMLPLGAAAVFAATKGATPGPPTCVEWPRPG